MSQAGIINAGGGPTPPIETLTGNSGGPVPPTGNNINTVGTGSITIVGNPGTSTLTTQLSGLTNHAVLVGAGTATITNVGPGASNTVLLGNTGLDPSFGQVPNAALVNSTITVTSPLGTISVGGSPVALGGTLTLDITGGATAIEKVNLQAGTSPIVPTAGAITLNGAVVAAGSTPIRTDGTGVSTAAIQVQTSQAIAATDATKIGLAAFDSASFAVDANGFVTMAGGGGFTWSNKSAAFNAVKNNGYFITGTCTASLPTNASSAIGDTIKFIVQGAFVLTLQAAASQKIQIASNLSSAAGTQVSTANGDAVEIVFNTTGNQWDALAFVGAWNFT